MKRTYEHTLKIKTYNTKCVHRISEIGMILCADQKVVAESTTSPERGINQPKTQDGAPTK